MGKKILDQIRNRFKNDTFLFSEIDNFRDMQSWAHTDCPTLEYNLGVLGLPTGIVEISGLSRSGKTTLGLVAMKNFLKDNPEHGYAFILSSENRDNRNYAEKIGVDIERVLILKIKFVEDMFMKVKEIIETITEEYESEKIKEKPKFYFMWDSLGATLSRAEIETMKENIETMVKANEKNKEVSKSSVKHAQMGAFAKNAKMFAKFLLGEMYDKIIHFVILNHMYGKMDGGRGYVSGGGNWVEFLPTLRLRLSYFKAEKIDDVEVAQYSKVKVVKNDFGSRKETVIEILLGKGIVLSQEDIDYAVELGIVDKVSARKYSFMDGKMTWNSKRTFYKLYEDNNPFLKILHKKLRNEVKKDIIASKKVKK